MALIPIGTPDVAVSELVPVLEVEAQEKTGRASSFWRSRDRHRVVFLTHGPAGVKPTPGGRPSAGRLPPLRWVPPPFRALPWDLQRFPGLDAARGVVAAAVEIVE